MKTYIKTMDKLPLLLKILLAIPCLQITWGLYRLFKSIQKKNLFTIIIAILLIFPGLSIMWIIDLITIIFTNQVIWFD